MELKVWVDGVVRVVCGLSQETSCQDVVIALAQAIGQTGRYVLIQKLRDTERQLLANERPLESLAKLGQHGSEVQFFLRRTGPSSSDSLPAGSQRSLTLPRPPPPAAEGGDSAPKRREPKKSLTFNLGPSSSPRAKPKQLRKSLPRTDSPEQRASPSPSPSPSPVPHTPSPPPLPAASAGPSKEEVFRHVLQQQERLSELEAQLEALERESRAWEQRSPSPAATAGCGEPPALKGELERLEETLRRNQAELAHEDYWQEELRVEVEHERSMRRRLGELHAKLDDCGRRLQDFNERAEHLERELQKESQAAAAAASPEESLEVVRAELQSRQQQGAELEAELSDTENTLGKAESLLQARQEELEELNKELRQCNLQQFIQQTGVVPAHSSSRSDLSEQLEQHMELAALLKEHYNMRSPISPPVDSPPRPTAKHFLGHPRNLQNPLVSSLNPEGVYV